MVRADGEPGSDKEKTVGVLAGSDIAEELIQATRQFVDRRVVVAAPELERENMFPGDLIREMADLGLFSLLVPEQFGGLEVDLQTYWRIVAEVSRGWMSLGGAINTHSISAYLVREFGTSEQQKTFLPPMASGMTRGAIAMTEANAGSDVAAIQMRADKVDDDYTLTGSKMFITNGEHAGVVLVLAITDSFVKPRHRGLSLFIAEPGPGLRVSRHIDKLGYNGIETVELVFDEFSVPASRLLGEAEGQGFYQVMAGSEIGRINVAARAIGVAQAALAEASRYALQRSTFGVPIAQHQAIQFLLAEIATGVAAAGALLDRAARARELGRADAEVGMAKLFATEMCLKAVTDAMRIHGGYGYTKEFLVERLYRDAPQMVVAEGTNEIQKIVIARDVLKRAERLLNA